MPRSWLMSEAGQRRARAICESAREDEQLQRCLAGAVHSLKLLGFYPHHPLYESGRGSQWTDPDLGFPGTPQLAH
jgi:hypothetical protein